MKIFIAVDMEGIAGLVQWDREEKELHRRLMTEEVNAAARGAFAGGAAEVLAGESHSNMRYLMPELLDPRVSFLSGQPKPMNHMAGVDNSFDLAIFAGYHSKAGTLHGVMSHTYSLNVFSLAFNNTEMGEIGVDAALCGFNGVPVGLVTGDTAACEEARNILGKVKTVAVKQGLSRSSARCLSIDRARVMIEEAAAEAVRQAHDFKPFTINGPVSVSVVFTDPSYADSLEHLDFVTRVDGRTVCLEAEDILKAFERFSALQYLAPVVR
ncbi:MAG: M55 family metallopeptidase [Desulfobacterales bacterium]|nr:M55 family metallopeptidase [Desulfobacterales bacterium]